jgi:hypothetical protein
MWSSQLINHLATTPVAAARVSGALHRGHPHANGNDNDNDNGNVNELSFATQLPSAWPPSWPHSVYPSASPDDVHDDGGAPPVGLLGWSSPWYGSLAGARPYRPTAYPVPITSFTSTTPIHPHPPSCIYPLVDHILH